MCVYGGGGGQGDPWFDMRGKVEMVPLGVDLPVMHSPENLEVSGKQSQQKCR